MIFTSCDCGESIVVYWKSGDRQGFYRTDCEKCGKIAMTELSSFGQTWILKDEEELEKFVEEKGLNKPKQ